MDLVFQYAEMELLQWMKIAMIKILKILMVVINANTNVIRTVYFVNLANVYFVLMDFI